MGATYRKRGRAWLVTIHWQGERELKTVRMKADAIALVREIHKQELAGIEQIRNPLRGYFETLIETKVLSRPNPAEDLKFFIGKGAHRTARRRTAAVYFAQDEGLQLVATAKALHPRWHPFILTGLRQGESAALRRSDVDWQRGYLTIDRTVSDKGERIETCK